MKALGVMFVFCGGMFAYHPEITPLVAPILPVICGLSMALLGVVMLFDRGGRRR